MGQGTCWISGRPPCGVAARVIGPPFLSRARGLARQARGARKVVLRPGMSHKEETA